MLRIENAELAVEIAELGAELQSIASPGGAQWLWDGEAQWWTGRAPLLFPVVGRSPDNAVTIDGRRYPMQSHGFARRSIFEVVQVRAERATLTLRASEATRQSFPFDFFLTVTHELREASLVTTAEVGNLDKRDMPFGLGFHPAFRWPLPGGEGRRHLLRLAGNDEPTFVQLNGDGLLLPDVHPSPFSEGELTLEHELFKNDALLFPSGVGDGLVYEAEGGSSVTLVWKNLPNFAVWQKPGAPYICLEPWHGMAARVGAGDALVDRPSTAVLPPGETATFVLAATFSLAG